MKRIKKLTAGVFLMGIAVTELMACVPNRQRYEEQAVQLLQEEYDEEFEIEKYMGHQSMNEYYEVTAFSKKYPEVLFEAKAACDGSYILDEYVASRVCRTVEEQIENNLSGLQGYIQIKVQAISKSIDSNKADMSIQEFMSIKTQNRFVVYLTCSPVKTDMRQLYQTLSGAFTGLECITGSIKLYITDQEILKQVQKYLEENAKVDYEFDEALEHTRPITIPFENGVLQLSESEFIKEAGGTL